MKWILKWRTKHNQFIMVFYLGGGGGGKWPDFFQVAIRFHPAHPWPKALIYSFSALMEQL